MPSATTVYSLPAQLGRRGTTAVIVIALHVVMAIGLITAMALRIAHPPDQRITVITVPPEPPPAPRVQTSHGGSSDAVVLPPIIDVPIDDPDVKGPPAPIVIDPVMDPPIAETGIVSPVRVLNDPPPPYPAAERRLQHEGVVTLRVRVGTTGRAEQVEIATSSGHTRLDAAALEAVRHWIFAPAQNASGALSSWVTLTVRFQLMS